MGSGILNFMRFQFILFNGINANFIASSTILQIQILYTLVFDLQMLHRVWVKKIQKRFLPYLH